MSRDVLPKLATEATLSILDKLERKMSRRRSVRAGIRFSLCILTEDMDNIIKIVDSLENSCLSIDGATKLVKYEIKKKTRKWISWSYDSTYGYFTDSTYGFFIDPACAFFIDKSYN